MNTKIIIAALYIFYGITKLIIGLSVLSLPTAIIAKIPVLKWFIKVIADKTIAGRFYEYILLLFGIYTIIHGFAILEIFPSKYNKFIERKQVLYTVFEFFGIVLTVFYSLVVYTDLPISKEKEKYNDYKLFGLTTGLLFIVSPLLWEAFEYISPVFRSLSTEIQNIILLSTLIIVLLIGDYLYNYMHVKPSAKKIIPSDYQNAYDHITQPFNKKLHDANISE